MSTIKVLHVIARMNVGGTARYVGDLVANIPDSALVTGYVQGSEIEDPVVNDLTTFRLVHMGRKISPINDFKAWLELRRIVREVNPEILHTHTFKAGLIGRLVGGNYKRVHTFHGHLFGDQTFSALEKFAISRIEKFLASRTDLLISVGERVGVELREFGIGTSNRWVSISPGVNPLPTIEKSKAREILDLDPESILIGWMARVTGVKNPYLLVEVAKHLPEIKFVMAGGGDLLEEIRKIAPNNLQILGWTDASLFWSAIDIALSTSYNEGMPIALIEAQMAGIPVVATDVGSNAEVIVSGETGEICPRDLKSIRRALILLTSDEKRLYNLGIKAKTRATLLFSRERFINQHVENYQSLNDSRR